MRVSESDLSDLIKYYSVIFDNIRIIDKNRQSELLVLDDGSVKECEFHCTWYDGNCDKCRYQRDIFEDEIVNKIEIIDGEFKHIINIPLEINGKKWIMQLMTGISNIISDIKFKKENIVELVDKYKNQLYTDPLTKIYNRRFYEDKLIHLKTANGAAMIDVDNFKTINDTYGHKAGDYVLKAVASTIKDNIRSSDAVVRYGGDEFFVLFWNIPKDVLQLKLEEILDAISDIRIENNPDIRISISIGYVHRVDLTEKLLIEADNNMYKAKNGKDRLVTDK